MPPSFPPSLVPPPVFCPRIKLECAYPIGELLKTGVVGISNSRLPSPSDTPDERLLVSEVGERALSRIPPFWQRVRYVEVGCRRGEDGRRRVKGGSGGRWGRGGTEGCYGAEYRHLADFATLVSYLLCRRSRDIAVLMSRLYRRAGSR